MTVKLGHDDLVGLTAEIASAYVSSHNTPVEQLPALLQSIYNAVAQLGPSHAAHNTDQQPAVPVEQSIFPDYLVCLEDGKKLKMLKRYLKTNFNMSVEQYRNRWNLPPDYPMVAPNYAEKRSSLARTHGLGRQRKTG